MTFGTEGKVVRIPGMPPMYDYEYYPQDVSVYSCYYWLCRIDRISVPDAQRHGLEDISSCLRVSLFSVLVHYHASLTF